MEDDDFRIFGCNGNKLVQLKFGLQSIASAFV